MNQPSVPFSMFRLFGFLCAALAVAVFLFPGHLAAHNGSDPEFADMSLKDLMSLEVFTAASLVPIEYRKAPGTAYSFDRTDFARLGIRRIVDLLQFVPGFQLN